MRREEFFSIQENQALKKLSFTMFTYFYTRNNFLFRLFDVSNQKLKTVKQRMTQVKFRLDAI